jgi:NADH-quinone oxidoreductase subunit E
MNKYLEIIKKYPADKSYLIEILREIQTTDGFVSNQAISVISKELKILDIDVEGVINFYSMLSQVPKGKTVIRVCKTACCHVKGAPSIIDAIKKEIGVSELEEVSADGLFSVEQTECIGQCDQAPAMLVNDKPYGNLTADKISDILKEYK